ncbi:Cell division protein FtsN [Tepidimonas alkaliphilus]|uniref:Cell division protein FtsN n=1 Tax=Tepidimonas alkaliphilus TaxID=2588942 RepID=A0A554W7Q3_9BURK|nr:SPOR domain-containing protein [Tepidimonas alkaliphilus]TSE19604.1 Cell division protein FtsN [Tepidimonas alkaliphilus]
MPIAAFRLDHAPSRARGGTLLGFFIGLLVGVGAALAVAVYVTKVPIPLVDRGVQRKPIQPDTEAERLRGWNPNAGLSSAKPTGGSEAMSGGGADQPSAASPAEPLSSGGAPAPSPEASRDPIAELIRQRTAAATSPGESVSTAADPFIYYVQAGAFRNPEEAEAQRARLALQGFDAKVSEREQGGQRVWRVRLGPFNSKVEAEVMQERLRGKQFDTALVRVQR